MDFYGILQKYITDEGIEKYARIVAETDMERIGVDLIKYLFVLGRRMY